MAALLRPQMTLSIAGESVKITVSYSYQLTQQERLQLSNGSQAFTVTEQIDVLGGIMPLSYNHDLGYPEGIQFREKVISLPRQHFDVGTADAVVRCRIRILVNPRIGAERETNEAVVRSRVPRPYVPRKRLGVVLGATVGAMVLGSAVASLLSRERTIRS